METTMVYSVIGHVCMLCLLLLVGGFLYHMILPEPQRYPGLAASMIRGQQHSSPCAHIWHATYTLGDLSTRSLGASNK